MKRRIQSFGYALRGIAQLMQGANARLQVLAAMGISALAWYFEFAAWEWIVVVLCISAVLSAEAFNTALEQLCDEVSLERRQRIRKAKDLAAGAVLISSVGSVVVAVFLLWPRLFG